MSQNKISNAQDFTQGAIFTKLIRFMLPILGAQILQAMYGAVDLLIVGHFGTTAGISGVSTGSSILNLATFVVSALASAVMVLIGNYLGKKQPEKIGSLLGNAITFFFVLSLFFTFALIVFARPIAVLMQSPAESLDLTVLYIRICGAGVVFIIFYNLISNIFRGLGDSNLPLLFVGIACAVNIAGDLILIAGLKMNVAGAALATVFAQAVSVILSILIIRKKKLPFEIHKKDLRLGEYIPQMLHIGIPLSVQEVLTNVTFLAICAFVNKMGLDASSGYGVAQKIQAFVMLIPGSIMQSMGSFVAQNVGARQESRAKRGMAYGMLVGGSIGIVICVAAFFKGNTLAAIFTSDEKVIARAFEFLRGFSLEAVITSILFSFLGYFNGHGKSLFIMIQGLLQSFLVRLPFSYFMSIRPDASLTGVGFAAPSATIFGIILCTVYYIKMNKQTKMI